MAILNILKEGDETLRKKCRRVEEITPRILQLLDDMHQTLEKAQGVGLAAPQVGVLRRIVIVEIDDKKYENIRNSTIISDLSLKQALVKIIIQMRLTGLLSLVQTK
jgi:peptide deformylase